MSSGRKVRFRRRESTSAGSFPLFSPSQVSGQEKVLVPIFAKKHLKDDDGPPIRKDLFPSKPMRASTQPPGLMAESILGSAQSPENQNSFHSTIQSHFPSPISAISALTENTMVSFKSVRDIEMLSVGYIQNCNSKEDLQNIIEVLSDVTTAPSLLQHAKDRLEAIQTGSGIGRKVSWKKLHDDSDEFYDATNKSHVSSDGVATNPSPISTPAASTDTLVMSLSPSLDGLELIPSPPKKPYSNQPVQPLPQYQQIVKDQSEEVRRLTRVVREKETAQRENLERIQALENEIQTAKQKMQQLKNELVSESTNKQELARSIRHLQKTNATLESRLKDELARKKQQEKESREVEIRLRLEVDALARDLKKANQHKSELEKKLKSRLGSDAVQSQQECVQLNKELRVLRRDYADLARDNSQGLVSIMNALGLQQSERERLNRLQYNEVLGELVAKMENNRLAVNTIGKAYSSLEKDRRVERMMHRKKLEASAKTKKELDDHNRLLTRQISELNEEIAKHESRIDSLLKQSEARRLKEVKDRERIQSLEQQIRSSSDSVPRILYEEAKLAYDEQKKKVSKLSSRVAQLELERRGVAGSNRSAGTFRKVRISPSGQVDQKEALLLDAALTKPRPPALSLATGDTAGQCNTENRTSLGSASVGGKRFSLIEARKTPGSRAAILDRFREVRSPKPPPTPPPPPVTPKYSIGAKENLVTPGSSGTNGKKFTRSDAVRAVGGRSALAAKYKQARSPYNTRSPLQTLG